MLLGNVREEFAEAPNPALIERFQQTLAMNPQSLKGRRVVAPFGQHEFEQVATMGATKVLGRRRRGVTAGDAAEARGSGMNKRSGQELFPGTPVLQGMLN